MRVDVLAVVFVIIMVAPILYIARRTSREGSKDTYGGDIGGGHGWAVPASPTRGRFATIVERHDKAAYSIAEADETEHEAAEVRLVADLHNRSDVVGCYSSKLGGPSVLQFLQG